MQLCRSLSSRVLRRAVTAACHSNSSSIVSESIQKAPRAYTACSALQWPGASAGCDVRRSCSTVSQQAATVGHEAGAGSSSSGGSGSSSAGDGSHDSTTHFGFRTVDESAKEGMVGEIFSRVAETYDLMNDAMSFGMHRLWKDEFVRMLGPIVSREGNTRVLDVAGGTGDTAFRIVDGIRATLEPHGPERCEVVVCDINPDMLEVGKQRAEARGYAGAAPLMQWVEGNAEVLPFDDNTFDVYTITFGIRNVTHIDQALREAHRVLKPGGRFMCLEFSQVQWPVLKEVYDEYSFHVIPRMGQVIANDFDSYQYLVESIRQFPTQLKFEAMIQAAGFQVVSHTNLTGGICAVHSGFKL